MKTIEEISRALLMPFDAKKVHWRIGSTNAKFKKEGEKMKGTVLGYLDARDVMWRLDEVLGIDGWQCRYPFPGTCEIGIIVPSAFDGSPEWIWKANAAGTTQVEAEKGQASDAFKRAAVLLGVGRCYYDLPNNKYDLDEFKGKAYIPKPLQKELTSKLDNWNKNWIAKYLDNK